jgi:hypothetical protein
VRNLGQSAAISKSMAKRDLATLARGAHAKNGHYRNTNAHTPLSEAKTLKKRRMSRVGRAAIAAAARTRWAQYRGNGAVKAEKPAKKRGMVSAAVKAKLASIARVRCAKAKRLARRDYKRNERVASDYTFSANWHDFCVISSE